MIKRYITLLCAVCLLFTACKKEYDDYAFEEGPDERLAKTLEQLETQLTGAPGGWAATLEATSGSIYSFYFKFAANNRVVMYSDFNATTISTIKESSYRLKALQQPSLIFDTYSYIHLLADPDGSVNGGTNGSGLNTDFEFAFDPSAQTSQDTIRFIGRFKASKLTLTKLSKEVGDAIVATGFQRNDFDKIVRIPVYFKYIAVGGTNYEIRPEISRKQIRFLYKTADGAEKNVLSSYYLTPDGSIALATPITGGATSISQFKNIVWNNTDTTMTLGINGTNVPITTANKPIYIEAASAQNWLTWAKASTYVSSTTYFTVNGVSDGYLLGAIPGILRLDYHPLNVTGGNDYFRFARATAATSFGPAYSPPDFSTPGIAKFTLLGYVNGNLLPDQATVNKVLTVQANVSNANGMYLIQMRTGTTQQIQYDMVNATDARSWVRWTY